MINKTSNSNSLAYKALEKIAFKLGVDLRSLVQTFVNKIDPEDIQRLQQDQTDTVVDELTEKTFAIIKGTHGDQMDEDDDRNAKLLAKQALLKMKGGGF